MGRFRKAWRALTVKSAAQDATQEWHALADFLGVDAEDTSALSEATCYACLKTLSESVGKLPCKLLGRNDRDGVTVERGHPLFSTVAERPNRFMTATGFWATFEQNRCHFGNAYAYIGGYGANTQLWILPSDQVAVWYDDARCIDWVPFPESSPHTRGTRFHPRHSPAFAPLQFCPSPRLRPCSSPRLHPSKPGRVPAPRIKPDAQNPEHAGVRGVGGPRLLTYELNPDAHERIV